MAIVLPACGHSEDEWQAIQHQIADSKQQLSSENEAHEKLKKQLEEARQRLAALQAGSTEGR
jgi:hypothetical protein